MAANQQALAGVGASSSPKYDSLAYQGTTNDTTNRSTYTFLSAAIGSANANRQVIVAITAPDGTDTVSSATFGGVSATILGQVTGLNCCVALAIASVPTGTTATLAVTFSNTVTSCKIGWWTVNMTSKVAHQVVTAVGENSGNLWVDIPGVDIPTNGFAVTVAAVSDLTAGTEDLAINQSFTENGDGTIDGAYGAAFGHREGALSGTVRWTATAYDKDPIAVMATFAGDGS